MMLLGDEMETKKKLLTFEDFKESDEIHISIYLCLR